MPARRSEQSRDIDAHVGERLRGLRELRGFSQADVAERLGLKSRQAVASYEAGDAVSAAVLFQLSHILQVEVGAFFDGLVDGRPQLAEAAPGERGSRQATQILALVRTLPPRQQTAVLKVVRAFAEALEHREDENGA